MSDVLELPRLTMPQQVASVIRQQILAGDLTPGAPLRQEQLSHALGVSRNTMREAMIVLVSEGIVRHSMHRGMTVAELTGDAVLDVARARLALEVAGLTLIARREVAVYGARLQKVMRQMTSAKSTRQVLEIDLEFHEVLIEPIGSERVHDFHRLIQTEVRLVHAWHSRQFDRAEFCADHQAIADCLEGGTVDMAIEKLRALSVKGIAEVSDADSSIPANW